MDKKIIEDLYDEIKGNEELVSSLDLEIQLFFGDKEITLDEIIMTNIELDANQYMIVVNMLKSCITRQIVYHYAQIENNEMSIIHHKEEIRRKINLM